MRMNKIICELPHDKTFFEIYTDFITEKKAENCTDYTINYYVRNINYFVDKYEIKYVDELNKELINKMIVDERKEHPDNSIRTTNTKIMALRTFIYYCQKRELIKPYRIKLLKTQQMPKETYTQEELKLLIQKPRSLRWAEWRTWAVVNYLIGTGNRASSIINIKIKDLDFANKTVILRHTKNKKEQIVPLTDALLECLDIYLKMWKWTEDDYLFPNYEGEQWAMRSFQKYVADYNKSRGVNKTSLHMFRRSFAQNYLQHGGSVNNLQQLLGHSTPQQSLYYARIFDISEITKNYDECNPLSQLYKDS